MTAPPKGIRILHVDDDPEFADLTATYIEREHERATVETAIGTSEGLARLDDSVDCVVSDYRMPEMDGIEFLRTVRERYPHLPFILFTSYGSEAVASEAISAGVTDYLQKRDGSDQYRILCTRIDNAVARRRAQVNYRELFEKTPIGLTIHDPDTGEILDANRAFGNLLDRDPDALEGTHPGELSPMGSEFDVETADRVIAETVASGSRQFGWRDKSSTGRVVDVEVRLQRVTIDSRQRVLAVVQETPTG